MRLFAAADADDEFAGWGGDADCADGIVTLDTDRHCSASFQPTRQALSVPASGATTGVSESGSRTTRASTESVKLTWEVSGDSRVQGYEVHYGPASGQYTFTPIDVAGHGSNTTTVPSLSNGETYYFAVRSRNTDGSQVSAFSNEICTTIGVSAPGPDCPSGGIFADGFDLGDTSEWSTTVP